MRTGGGRDHARGLVPRSRGCEPDGFHVDDGAQPSSKHSALAVKSSTQQVVHSPPCDAMRCHAPRCISAHTAQAQRSTAEAPDWAGRAGRGAGRSGEGWWRIEDIALSLVCSLPPSLPLPLSFYHLSSLLLRVTTRCACVRMRMPPASKVRYVS